MSIAIEKERSNLYLDKLKKQKAKEIFKKYGLSLSDAVNIFLSQTIYNNGLPFEMKIPNKETIQAMENAEEGIDLEEISLKELEKETKNFYNKGEK